MSSAMTAPTTTSSRPLRRRSSSAITPVMVAAAEMVVRKPTATQNNGSVDHQPAIRSVAMTAVAHPETMLATEVAIAEVGLARARRDGPTAIGLARGTSWVAGSSMAGWAPVGCRRMRPVGGSDPVCGFGPVGGIDLVGGSGECDGTHPVGGSDPAGRSDAAGCAPVFSGARRRMRVLSSLSGEVSPSATQPT